MKRTLACAVMVSAIIMASSLTVAVPQVVAALLTFLFGAPPFIIITIAGGAFITGFLLGVDTTSNLIIAL
ncbi:MAG: hypothetical protein D6723_05340 [Acidobacteria bacterium]|nr:MAG: hypothetical protein D6723_05340 [Acidobacteriota bacterium]